MLQPASSLLDMVSLRLPDSEELDADPRRRSGDGGGGNGSAGGGGGASNADKVNPVSTSSGANPPTGNVLEQIKNDLDYYLNNSLSDLVIVRPQSAMEVPSGLLNASGNASLSAEHVTDRLYRHGVAMSAVYCIAYVLVFVVGLIGNSFVIAVVYRSPRMRTVTNFFIVNLAVADILVIVFCLPATLMSNILVPWVLGWFMCKMMAYIQGVSVAASVYSLVAVSLDRLLAIWWPLKCQITKRRARMMIVVIWFVALTSTSPWLLFFDLVATYGDDPDLRLCIEMWPRPEDGSLFFLIGNLMLCYVLPMILISMCYVLIWIKVSRRHIPSDTKDDQMDRMQQMSKVKVVKMLVVVVIIFVLSWLPLYVIFARIKLGGDTADWEDEVLRIATPIAQWLGSSNSCINPILYAFFNKKYRRGFVAILKSGQCCGKLRYYETVAVMSTSTSMRKSSYYVNSSTKRAAFHAGAHLSHQDSNVSYIFNNHTGV